jgi:uncharacterized protein
MSGFGKRGTVSAGPSVPLTPLSRLRLEAAAASVPVETKAAPVTGAPHRQTRAGVAALQSVPAATASVSYDEGLRQYMLGIYTLMMLGVAFSGAICFALMNAPDNIQDIAFHPAMGLVVCLGTLLLSFFSNTIIESESPLLGHLFFWVYCALWGIGLTPIISYAVEMEHPEIVARAFFIAASMFGAATLYGYTTKSDLHGWGPILCMLSWGLFIATVLNCVIWRTDAMSIALCYATVLLFTVITAWETQFNKDIYNPAQTADQTGAKAVFGAFQLYGSFMMIFSRLLHIFLSQAMDD